MKTIKTVLPILKKNIINFNYLEKSKIIEKDIFNQLNFNTFENKFDIIFLDPPYKEKFLYELLKKIFKAKILNKEGIIIIHRHKNENDEFYKLLNIIEEKSLWYFKNYFWKILLN